MISRVGYALLPGRERRAWTVLVIFHAVTRKRARIAIPIHPAIRTAGHRRKINSAAQGPISLVQR